MKRLISWIVFLSSACCLCADDFTLVLNYTPVFVSGYATEKQPETISQFGFTVEMNGAVISYQRFGLKTGDPLNDSPTTRNCASSVKSLNLPR